MSKQMKQSKVISILLITLALFSSCMSVKLKDQSKAETARDVILYYGTDYVLSTPLYYTTDVIYTDYNWVRSLVAYPSNVICSIEYGCYYDQGYYYYSDYYYTFENNVPVYLFRKGENKQEKKADQKVEQKKVDLEKELNALKKEVLGSENASTTDVRKKAYDPRWLAAQLKISRVLAIEDLIVRSKADKIAEKDNQKANEGKKERVQLKVEQKKVEAQIEKKVEQKVEKKVEQKLNEIVNKA